ncbi:MAG: ADOP family duplicated permease, partial [Terriglobales bacterium]
MPWLKIFLRNLFRRRAADRELHDEIAVYAEEMNARRPHSVYPEPLGEQVRAARPGAGLESWARDLRYAARILRKSPALAAACILTFAIAVAANTVVFSMADALLWHPLPIPHPAELHLLRPVIHGQPSPPVLTGHDLRDLAAQSNSVFSAVTHMAIAMVGVSVGGHARIAFVAEVAGNFFPMMGVHPALGRFFTRSDAPEVVLGYQYWQSRFGGRSNLIGASAVVEGRPVTIVGVAPRGFHGISSLVDMQAFVPSALAPPAPGHDIESNLMPLVRLRPHATAAAAASSLVAFARVMAHEHPRHDRNLAFQMLPIGNGMANSDGSNPFGPVVALFLALGGLVLLLAAANIMGVLLARSRARRREMAMRAALGATRGRLARQLFLEAVLLAAVGAAAGMLLGSLAGNLLSASLPEIGVPLALRLGFDWHVFFYGCAMALVLAFVAGLLPAWRAAGADPNQVLRGPTNAPAGRRQHLRGSLVAFQVAVSLVLLIVGGLFLRSLNHAQRRPLGFQPAHLWNFVLDTGGAGLTQSQGQQFNARLLPQVRALPGVASASLATSYPFGIVSNDATVSAGARSAPVALNAVSPGYFSNLGQPLLQGRGFAAAGTSASPAVAVISRSLARTLFPGQDPLGRTIVQTNGGTRHVLQVVGVVAGAVYNLGNPKQPQLYLPLAQSFSPRQVLQVRTAATLATPVPEVERLLTQLAPDVPLGQVQPEDAALHGINGLYIFTLGARLATALGLLGLFLAVIGVYGVVAYAAAQRTREIGIRMALGARPRQVLAAILRQASLIVGVGVFLGLLAAAAFGKLAGAFLVGVSGLDPLTFIAASVLLLLVAFAASLLPALRASHTDPL